MSDIFRGQAQVPAGRYLSCKVQRRGRKGSMSNRPGLEPGFTTFGMWLCPDSSFPLKNCFQD